MRGGGRSTGERQVLILVEVFVCSCRRPLDSRRRALVASSRCQSRTKAVLPDPTASKSASSRREERCASGAGAAPATAARRGVLRGCGESPLAFGRAVLDRLRRSLVRDLVCGQARDGEAADGEGCAKRQVLHRRLREDQAGDDRPSADRRDHQGRDQRRTYRRSKTAMPADTTSVPMLMAKASVPIVVSENETLTTTRKAAAAAMASHDRKRGMMMLLWFVV